MMDLKASAVLKWDVTGDSSMDCLITATNFLKQLLKDNPNVKFSLKIEKPISQTGLKVIGEFLPDEVLPYISNSDEKKEFKANGNSYFVKMNSQRYFIFNSSRKCAACGVEGTKMMLEKHPLDKTAHFNLYAVENGKLILMTKDHILAKAHGGENRLSNYQVMCSICNNLKGSCYLDLESVKALRDFYNENCKILTKKKLGTELEKKRKELEKPLFSKIVINGKYIAKCDIAIVEIDNTLSAVSFFMVSEKMQHLASIKKWTILQVEDTEGVKYLNFNEQKVEIPALLC